jgi:hypothetical protein
METEPESSPRDQLASAPLSQIQCPRCGAWAPKQTMSYHDPQTGEQKNVGLPGWPFGCLMTFVVFVVLFVVLSFVGGAIWDALSPSIPNGPRLWDLGLWLDCLEILLSIAGAVAAILVYGQWRRRRRNRLRKTYLTVRHLVCRQCKHEWTVTQEPLSPASHASESAPAGTAPALPAEGATPAQQTALPAPLLSPPPLGQPKRRRSPAGLASLMLLALLLLGAMGISFSIYHDVTENPSGTSNSLNGVAWSGSQFVVVGDLGTILTSPDGHTWKT